MLNPAVARVAAVVARYALSTVVTFLLVKSSWLKPARRTPPRR